MCDMVWKHIFEWANSKTLLTLTYKIDLRRQCFSLQLFSVKHPNTARVTWKKLCICSEINTTRIRGNINSVVSRHKFILFFFFFLICGYNHCTSRAHEIYHSEDLNTPAIHFAWWTILQERDKLMVLPVATSLTQAHISEISEMNALWKH